LAISVVLASQSMTPRQMHSVLGKLTAAADLVPRGWARLRPLQWELMSWWDPRRQDWDTVLPLTAGIKQATCAWDSRPWLESGVPLDLPPPAFTICTDASGTGWDAHLLPDFRVTQGAWSPEETGLHSNLQGMLAVQKALCFWRDVCRGQSVMILTDNTSVCSCLRRQGGTHSRQLCDLALHLVDWCAVQEMCLRVRHLPGGLNVIADGLSRQSAPVTEWTLHMDVFPVLLSSFPPMSMDLFATRFYRRLELFASPFPDPSALCLDGLSLNWTGKDLTLPSISFFFPGCRTSWTTRPAFSRSWHRSSGEGHG